MLDGDPHRIFTASIESRSKAAEMMLLATGSLVRMLSVTCDSDGESPASNVDFRVLERPSVRAALLAHAELLVSRSDARFRETLCSILLSWCHFIPLLAPAARSSFFCASERCSMNRFAHPSSRRMCKQWLWNFPHVHPVLISFAPSKLSAQNPPLGRPDCFLTRRRCSSDGNHPLLRNI